MNKQEFLAELRKSLSGFPQDDIEERLTFYGEMIDDRMEEGLPEDDAVSQIGSVEDVISQIMAETPLTKLAKERVKPKRALKTWEIVLLVLGSPIWLSLCIAAFAVILALYVVLWAAIVSLWAVEAALWACALSGVVFAVVFAFDGAGLTGIAMLGAGLVCAGLSILLFFGCKAATRGIISLTKKIALKIKSLFIRKEDVK